MKRLDTLQSHGADDAEIAALGPWFHNLHLPDGRRTAPDHPLGDFPGYKWAELAGHLPADLHGVRALDIGCNAGFYSFALAHRGASVLAIDHDEHYLRQAQWAGEHLDPDRRVEFRRMTVYDLAHVGERFDVVLFLGVLYHLRYPALGLDIVTERVRGTLVLQTLTLPGAEPLSAPCDVPIEQRERLRAPGWPTGAFVEHRLAGDPTNWWLLDVAAVEAMLRSTGMSVVARPGDEMWLCERAAPFAHAAELRAAVGVR